jgi:hypothetical protein
MLDRGLSGGAHWHAVIPGPDCKKSEEAQLVAELGCFR